MEGKGLRATRLFAHMYRCQSNCVTSAWDSLLIKADNAVRSRLSGDQINNANTQLAFFVDRDALS